LEEVLDRRKAMLGPTNWQTLQSMWGLATNYESADRLEDAVRLCDEALKNYEAKFGPDHPASFETRAVRDVALGRLLLQQKKYAKAEPPLQRYGAFIERDKSGESASLFPLDILLGESLLGQKRYAEAEPRLIKGYSDTHLRAQSKFDRVLSALDLIKGRADAADWIRRLREAALKDEKGDMLDGALKTVATLGPDSAPGTP